MAVLTLAAAVGVGSFAFTLIKVVLRDVSPLTLAAGRVVFSALAFGAVVTLQPHRRRPIERADRWRVLACGLGGSAGFHVLFSWGQARVSVALAAVTLALMPVLVALAEVVLLHHRLGRAQVGGLVLSVAGVVAVSWGPGDRTPTSLVGLAAVAGATVVWAGVTVLTRTLADRYDPWWLNTPGTVVGAAVMLVVAAPRLGELGGLPALGWVQVVWLGAVSSAGIYAALARAMRDFPATVVASAGTLVTPLGVLIAWVGLGERPVAVTVLGAVAATVGVALTVRSPAT